MDLLQRFKDFAQQEGLFATGDRLLLAVSGGLDSVVLCELCRQAGQAFEIAHCNFRLRAKESERDEAFVRQLAIRYQVPIHVKAFDTVAYASQNKLSVQVAARELRYAWFSELLDDRDKDLSFLATAHHLDDSIETMLMNFFKGTGLAGLRGILPRQGRIVRPLLFARKNMLGAFALQHKLDWVEDSSNASDKYTRNYFRHHVLPAVSEAYSEADDNLADNLPRFRDAALLYGEAVDRWKKKLLEYRGNEIHIPILKLKKATAPVTLLYEITKDLGFSPAQLTDIMGLLNSSTGKYVSSATHRIFRNREWLIIAPLQQEVAGIVLIEGPGEWSFAGGTLHVSETSSRTLPAIPQHVFLNADELKFPLLLRPWKQSDYFYPLGMKKKKKLARFLIDLKLSKTEKERVWVLESDKRIAWVMGYRIDDRFRIDDRTKSVLSLRITSNVRT